MFALVDWIQEEIKFLLLNTSPTSWVLNYFSYLFIKMCFLKKKSHNLKCIDGDGIPCYCLLF